MSAEKAALPPSVEGLTRYSIEARGHKLDRWLDVEKANNGEWVRWEEVAALQAAHAQQIEWYESRAWPGCEVLSKGDACECTLCQRERTIRDLKAAHAAEKDAVTELEALPKGQHRQWCQYPYCVMCGMTRVYHEEGPMVSHGFVQSECSCGLAAVQADGGMLVQSHEKELKELKAAQAADQALAQRVRDILADRQHDLTQQASDACEQCGPMVLCAYHSLLSELAGQVTTNAELERERREAAHAQQEEKAERVFQAVVYAFEGKDVPEDLREHGMVKRGQKHWAAHAAEKDALISAIAEDSADAWTVEGAIGRLEAERDAHTQAITRLTQIADHEQAQRRFAEEANQRQAVQLAEARDTISRLTAERDEANEDARQSRLRVLTLAEAHAALQSSLGQQARRAAEAQERAELAEAQVSRLQAEREAEKQERAGEAEAYRIQGAELARHIRAVETTEARLRSTTELLRAIYRRWDESEDSMAAFVDVAALLATLEPPQA